MAKIVCLSCLLVIQPSSSGALRPLLLCQLIIFPKTDSRDKIHEGICAKLGITPDTLSLAQVLEACTWKGGREIAASKRSNGGRESSYSLRILTTAPVEIVSDGTVF